MEHIPKGCALIAANHLSFLDPPLICASCPEELNYFAKASLFKNPIFGYLISKLNAHPVKGDSEDIATFKLLLNCLRNEKKVLIFPEGKRSSHGHLNEFKPGFAMVALKTHCPIIPTYLHGTYDIWNPQKKYPKLSGKTACIFGSPIDVASFAHLPKKEAQKAISEATRRAIEYLKLWYEAGAIGSPP